MLDYVGLLLANIQSKENEMCKTGWRLYYIFPILGKHAKTYVQFLVSLEVPAYTRHEKVESNGPRSKLGHLWFYQLSHPCEYYIQDVLVMFSLAHVLSDNIQKYIYIYLLNHYYNTEYNTIFLVLSPFNSA